MLTTRRYAVSRSLDCQVLDALLNALDIGLNDIEYDLAREALCELDAAFEYPPSDLAERLVTEFEKSLGLGLDTAQYGSAVVAIKAVLPSLTPRLPTPTPDAFLEAAYEDAVTGDYEE